MSNILLTFCVLGFSVHTVQNALQRRSTNDVYVRELEITSNAALRYANVLVKSVMINRKSSDQEVSFQVRLPKEAFITSFVIFTNNRTIEAIIKEKKKAQEAYDKAKEDNVTAGLVSHQGISDDLDLDIFQIEVNVAAKALVEFRLKYEEFLKRRVGKYTQKLFIDTDQTVPDLTVKCSYTEKQKFKYMSYKTPYKRQRVNYESGFETDDGYYVNTVNWKPNIKDQEVTTLGLEAPFVVEYELELEDNGGMVFINKEGNFVHLFSVPCDDSNIMIKQIVFVIDISGSMGGNPIQQVRQAMEIILSELRPRDYFTIIIFDGKVSMWETGFLQANPSNVNAAKKFVKEKVVASGSTNINEAMLKAIDLFGRSMSVERYGQTIFFLTDGQPSAGVTNTSAIRQNVRDKNYVREECCKSTINTIAFGRNADINFLQLIAYDNAGTLTVIKEVERDSEADDELISTYNEFANPYFKDLVFSFDVNDEILPETSMTQLNFRQYDCKSEIVVSGEVGPGEQVFPKVKVVAAHDDVVFNNIPTILIVDEQSHMLTRLAVYQRVKYLLKKAKTTLDPKEKETANKAALELSLNYTFVTPLTSLIVTDYPTAHGSAASGQMESGRYNIMAGGYPRAKSADQYFVTYSSGHSNSISNLGVQFCLSSILLVVSMCIVKLL